MTLFAEYNKYRASPAQRLARYLMALHSIPAVLPALLSGDAGLCPDGHRRFAVRIGPVQADRSTAGRTSTTGWSAILGIRFEWDGEIPDGAYLIAVKHQAMVETVETLRFATTPVVVMKRELTDHAAVRLGDAPLRRRSASTATPAPRRFAT